jgi:hypothetical protein
VQRICTVIAVLTLTCASGQNPFAKIKYDSVVAYNFALKDSRVHAILNKDSTLEKSTVLPGRKLIANETAELLGILNNKKTYGGPVMACFDPKHAFIFYREKRIVGLIEICFDCNFLRSTPELPAMRSWQDFEKDQVMDWGFNRSSGKKLRDFCRRLGLETKEPHFPGEE